MEDTPDNGELAHRFALLEARMDTQLAKNESAIDRMNTILADFKTESAKRETRLILTMAGMIGLAAAVLGILIRWPAPPV